MNPRVKLWIEFVVSSLGFVLTTVHVGERLQDLRDGAADWYAILFLVLGLVALLVFFTTAKNAWRKL